MRNYETMFITAPTVAPEAYDRLLDGYKDIISENGGQITNVVKWGRRTLAYEINRFREGIYTILEFDAPPDLIKEFERRLRLNDSVLKYLTIKTERKDKLVAKGSAKRKAKQDAKSKRHASRSSDDRKR